MKMNSIHCLVEVSGKINKLRSFSCFCLLLFFTSYIKCVCVRAQQMIKTRESDSNAQIYLFPWQSIRICLRIIRPCVRRQLKFVQRATRDLEDMDSPPVLHRRLEFSKICWNVVFHSLYIQIELYKYYGIGAECSSHLRIGGNFENIFPLRKSMKAHFSQKPPIDDKETPSTDAYVQIVDLR